MATKTNATPQKEEVPKKKGPETPPDNPPLDWPPQLAAAQLYSFPGLPNAKTRRSNRRAKGRSPLINHTSGSRDAVFYELKA